MTWASIDVFFFAIFAGACVRGFKSARALPEKSRPADRLLKACLAPCAVVLAALLARALLQSPFWEFSSGRLAPLIAMKFGYPLYSPPGQGALFVTQYGPMAFLSYALALAGSTPLAAILLGAASAMLWFFLPVFVVCAGRQKDRNVDRSAAIAGFLVFALFTFQSPALSYAAFTVHADAPELGLGAAACAALFFRRNRGRSVSLAVSAFFAVLAVWAKPTAFPVLIGSAVFLYLSEDARSSGAYAAWALVEGCAVSVFFILVFHPRALLYNVFALTSRYPFMKTSFGVPGAIFGQLPGLLKEYAIPGVIVHFGLWRAWATADRDGPIRVKDWVKAHRWVVFVMAAFAMVPVSLVHKTLVAADVNAFADTVYYLGIAAALILCEGAAEPAGRLALALSLMMLALLPLPSLTRLSIDARAFCRNPRSSAYDFARRHPGQVYFPLDPLATLFAEGKLYHYDVGLFDADLFHLAVSPEQFHDYLPAHLTYLGYEAHNQYSRVLFPQFTRPLAVAELPGWTILTENNSLAQSSNPY